MSDSEPDHSLNCCLKAVVSQDVSSLVIVFSFMSPEINYNVETVHFVEGKDLNHFIVLGFPSLS